MAPIFECAEFADFLKRARSLNPRQLDVTLSDSLWEGENLDQRFEILPLSHRWQPTLIGTKSS